MNKTFYYLRCTFFSTKPDGVYVLYCEDYADGAEIKKELSYMEAMITMRRLEKKLNKLATLEVNPYNHHIYSKEICGFA